MGRRVERRRAWAWRLLLAVIIAGCMAGLFAGPQAKGSVQSPRTTAFLWARAQAGKPYLWGGNGPSSFDCSGLVVAAYRQAGITLPRTTYTMLTSGKLIPEPLAAARRGDLLFYGAGHVEMDVSSHSSFGALEPGTLIGWHQFSAYWHPTMAFRVR